MRENSFYARRDNDGMAVIGRTVFALRGIRFEEGENGDDPVVVDTTDVVEPVDTSVFEAKIAELTAALAAKEVELAAKDAELIAAKAVNYDLLMATPVEPDTMDDPADGESGDDADITIDDLFGKDDD